MKVSRMILAMALVMLLTSYSFAAISTSHVSLTTMNGLLKNIGFVAQAQIGDELLQQPTGDWELAIGPTMTDVTSTADYPWQVTSGHASFVLTYDAVKILVTYTVYYDPTVPPIVLTFSPEAIPNDIFIRTRAVLADTSTTVVNLVLNGIPIADVSASNGNANKQDILWIKGAALSRGFTLTGNLDSINLYWDAQTPTGSQLLAQFIVGSTVSNPICYQPVTLTVAGWVRACQNTPGYPNLYTGFPIAFRNFTFFGKSFPNQLVVGGKYTLAYAGKTYCINNLCAFLAQDLDDTCGPLHQNWACYASLVNGSGLDDNSALAQEVIALALNIAFNDARLMPRSRGFDLEKFIVTQGIFKGKTVGQVLNIANAVLGGAAPCQFGLPTPPQAGGPELGCQQLLDILRHINYNYAFVNINTFTDRGYLRPPSVLGLAAPPHQFVEPVL